MMPEPVPQPLHRRAGDEDRAFQRVGPLAVQLPGDGRQQPVLGEDRHVAGIQQREAAGAIGGFQHPRREAGLPQRRRLLVPRHAADRHRRAQHLRRGHAEFGGAVPHLRQDRRRDVEQPQQLRVPGAAGDVEQQGPRRIGRIRRMHPATGQPPQQEAVHRAEGQLPALRLGPRARHVVQQPGQLGRGEIRVRQQPGPGGDQRLLPRRPQRARRPPPCAGPARRWRGAPPARWPGPTAPPSPAGW